jgi:hypothetical protein
MAVQKVCLISSNERFGRVPAYHVLNNSLQEAHSDRLWFTNLCSIMMMDQATLRELLDDLERHPQCADWGAKLQFACEHLWETLGTTNIYSAATGMVDRLIHLLKDHHAMELARLVIPDLRSHEALVFTDPLKQKIFDSTTDSRSAFTKIETTTQTDFDTPLYRAEKELFTEAEMYRASLLLYGSATFTGVQEKEILDWLSKRPKGPQKT